MVAAYFEKVFNQKILLDCGATCSIISEKLLAQIKTKLCSTGRDLSVSGIGGKVKIKGFTVVWIDLGQGVRLKHTVLVCDISGGYDALLGNPFLARINAKVGMQHDYLEVPTSSVPIIVERQRYLENRH